MSTPSFSRRKFIKAAGMMTAMTALGKFPADLFAAADQRRMVRFPEKTDLILLTSRPPQLETPLSYFSKLITPNDELFVRWHISGIPTSVDLATWRLVVNGNTEKELQLSMDELKTKFEKVSYTAVIQCSGNSRSFFEPRVPGGQWENGAMGNVTWTGARLRDVLNAAGIKAGSVEISFDGLDRPPLPSVPDFVKSLSMDKALEEDLMIAYEMNGSPLTFLNGFPARLIVPGWFATYWVKSLSTITVLPSKFEGFWMKSAYRIPDDPCACVPPGSAPKKTIPINSLDTRSFIIKPSDGEALRVNRPAELMGIAFSGGYGISSVLVSADRGRTWNEADLGKDMGKYAWRQWTCPWRPNKAGKYTLMVRATDGIGGSQPVDALWNPAGFMRNKIEKIEVMVR
jgi:sulfite dehydrogenase